jgi:hypothetical protein
MEYKNFFTEYVLNTPPQAPIPPFDSLVCRLRPEKHDFLGGIYKLSSPEIYVSNWSLKHAYDTRPEFMISHLDDIPGVFEEPDGIARTQEVFGLPGRGLR